MLQLPLLRQKLRILGFKHIKFVILVLLLIMKYSENIRIYQLINFVIIIVDSEGYRYLVYFLFIQPNIEYNTLKNNMPVAQES